jgi:hypothetical protein
MISQLQNGSEELRLARKRLDELLVVMAFLVFVFDNSNLRGEIEAIEQDIASKVIRLRQQFVDQLPLRMYLSILERQFRSNEPVFQSLNRFFDDLIRTATLDQATPLEQRATNLERCVELLIGEAGRRIEKPDRIFHAADILDSISVYADSLFDTEGERFFKKYKWAYPRGQSFDNLNMFWTAGMVGLFAFEGALERHVVSVRASETEKTKAAVSTNGIFKNNGSSAIMSMQKRLFKMKGCISLHSHCREHGRDWITTFLAITQSNLSKVIRIVTGVRVFDIEKLLVYCWGHL